MDNIFNLSSFSSSLGNPGRSDSRSFQVGGKSAKDRGASFIEDQVNFGRSTGYLRSNRYCILFQGVPSSLEMQRQDNGFLWGLDNKRLSLNCLQATIPESSFSTSDLYFSGKCSKRLNSKMFSSEVFVGKFETLSYNLINVSNAAAMS